MTWLINVSVNIHKHKVRLVIFTSSLLFFYFFFSAFVCACVSMYSRVRLKKVSNFQNILLKLKNIIMFVISCGENMSRTWVCQYIIFGGWGFNWVLKNTTLKFRHLKNTSCSLSHIRVRLGIQVEGSSPPCFDSEIKAAGCFDIHNVCHPECGRHSQPLWGKSMEEHTWMWFMGQIWKWHTSIW